MKFLALIPARAGSKRVLGKNMAVVKGRSLTSWAIAQALGSGRFGPRNVVVSTDWNKVADLATGMGVVVHARPPELARDETPMIDLIRAFHSREWGAYGYDAIVLLQPTSPLRTGNDIFQACRLMEATGAEAVVSVCPPRYNESYVVGHAGRIRPVPLDAGDEVAVPNGAIFILKGEAIDRGKDWFSADLVYAYKMPAERSLDIDTPDDLEAARRAMQL